MTEASPVMRLIDARPARFVPLGRYSYVAVVPPSVFFVNVSIDCPFDYRAISIRSLFSNCIVTRLGRFSFI